MSTNILIVSPLRFLLKMPVPELLLLLPPGPGFDGFAVTLFDLPKSSITDKALRIEANVLSERLASRDRKSPFPLPNLDRPVRRIEDEPVVLREAELAFLLKVAGAVEARIIEYGSEYAVPGDN